MDEMPRSEGDKWSLTKRTQTFVAAALILTSAVALGAAAGVKCTREVVEGNLDGAAEFEARDVIVYAAGMFPGNPVVVRIVGHVDASGWYNVELPGVRAADQLRVVGDGPRVGAYFLEERQLNFYADIEEGGAPGPIDVYYIAGSASWGHHYELDFNRSDLTMVGRVDWYAKVMFRSVNMLFVSGKLHASPNFGNGGTPAPAASGLGPGVFDFSSRVTSAETDHLAAFSVPSSSDEGIYVIHRVENVDMPGSNGHGLRACTPTAFYMRVHESPVEVAEVALVADGLYPFSNATLTGAGSPARLVLEVENMGDLPWMPGRADIYRGGILAGSDDIPYTARGADVRVEMGSVFDLEAERTVEGNNTTRFYNYTLRNRDLSAYTVEVTSTVQGAVVDAGPFTREGRYLTARLRIDAGETIRIGWQGAA